jgi:hypothetical protein
VKDETLRLPTFTDLDEFDWLAVVILPGPGCDRRRFFIVPRDLADERATPVFGTGRKEIPHVFGCAITS